MLRARGEVEAAQGGVDVIAGRLEDLIEEIEDLRLQPRHLRREAEQRTAVLGRRLVLQAVERFPRSAAPAGRSNSIGNLADQVLGLVGGLERRAPDLPAAGLAEVAEILGEARDQIGLGEQRIDREIDLEPLVQFEQPRADRVGMGRDLLAAAASGCLRG